jgi:hypothetical protein
MMQTQRAKPRFFFASPEVPANTAGTSFEPLNLDVRQVSFDDESCHGNNKDRSETSSPTSPPILFQSGEPDDDDGHNKKSLRSVIPVELTSYWYSRDAEKFFSPRENETAEEAVDEMIRLLEEATSDHGAGNACLSIIEGNDKYGICTQKEKWKIYVKARYIRNALQLAKVTIKAGKRFSFHGCCEQTLGVPSPRSSAITRNSSSSVKPSTVTKWFRDFRQDRVFKHPNRGFQKGLVPLLSFFEQHPLQLRIFMFRLSASPNFRSPKYAYCYFCSTIIRNVSKDLGYDDTEVPWRVMAHHNLRLNSRVFRDWMVMKGLISK